MAGTQNCGMYLQPRKVQMKVPSVNAALSRTGSGSRQYRLRFAGAGQKSRNLLVHWTKTRGTRQCLIHHVIKNKKWVFSPWSQHRSMDSLQENFMDTNSCLEALKALIKLIRDLMQKTKDIVTITLEWIWPSSTTYQERVAGALLLQLRPCPSKDPPLLVTKPICHTGRGSGVQSIEARI